MNSAGCDSIWLQVQIEIAIAVGWAVCPPLPKGAVGRLPTLRFPEDPQFGRIGTTDGSGRLLHRACPFPTGLADCVTLICAVSGRRSGRSRHLGVHGRFRRGVSRPLQPCGAISTVGATMACRAKSTMVGWRARPPAGRKDQPAAGAIPGHRTLHNHMRACVFVRQEGGRQEGQRPQTPYRDRYLRPYDCAWRSCRRHPGPGQCAGGVPATGPGGAGIAPRLGGWWLCRAETA